MCACIGSPPHVEGCQDEEGCFLCVRRRAGQGSISAAGTSTPARQSSKVHRSKGGLEEADCRLFVPAATRHVRTRRSGTLARCHCSAERTRRVGSNSNSNSNSPGLGWRRDRRDAHGWSPCEARPPQHRISTRQDQRAGTHMHLGRRHCLWLHAVQYKFKFKFVKQRPTLHVVHGRATPNCNGVQTAVCKARLRPRR